MAHLNNTLINGDLTVTGKINNDLFNKYKLRRKYNFSMFFRHSYAQVTPQICPFSYDKFRCNGNYSYLWDSGTTGLILAYNDGRKKLSQLNVRHCGNDLYSSYNNHLYLSGAPVDLNALTFENLFQNLILDNYGRNIMESVTYIGQGLAYNYACKFHCLTQLTPGSDFIMIAGKKLSWRGMSIFLKPVFNYKLLHSYSNSNKYWQGDVNGYGLLLKFILGKQNSVYVYAYIKCIK